MIPTDVAMSAVAEEQALAEGVLEGEAAGDAGGERQRGAEDGHLGGGRPCAGELLEVGVQPGREEQKDDAEFAERLEELGLVHEVE